ncbi:hypothetical protein APHAL10511_004637 [Amanita phalloides]|nr:hypothetical protein APHAL10511_004637 [Amanita phalloides]
MVEQLGQCRRKCRGKSLSVRKKEKKEETSSPVQAISTTIMSFPQAPLPLVETLGIADRPRFRILVVGRYDTGKASLINAIFKDFMATCTGITSLLVLVPAVRFLVLDWPMRPLHDTIRKRPLALQLQSCLVHVSCVAWPIANTTVRMKTNGDGRKQWQQTYTRLVASTMRCIFFDRVPFLNKNEFQITMLVTSGRRPDRPTEPRMANDVWNLIQDCWASNPSERPTMEDVVAKMTCTDAEVQTRLELHHNLVGSPLQTQEELQHESKTYTDAEVQMRLELNHNMVNSLLLPLLSILRDRKPTSTIASVVNDVTVDHMRTLLSTDNYVDVALQLTDPLDIENILDFVIYLLVNGYLEIPDANRRARRLMLKIVTKRPVIPRSLFVSGVSIKTNDNYIGGGGFGFVLKGEVDGSSLVHGDLRGDNVLLDANFHARIADFGLTRHSEATVTGSGALHFHFAAPELFGYLEEDEEDARLITRTYKSDVYAFGVFTMKFITVLFLSMVQSVFK